ncbi:MAG: hypothetical protein WCP82_08755, partial [Alphaproteobacteria bacterium]
AHTSHGGTMAKKIASTMNLTERQTVAIRKEAAAKDVSFGEILRRIIDDWMERKPRLGDKLYDKQ